MDLWRDWDKKVKEIDGLRESLKKAIEQWNDDIGHGEYGREAVRRLQQQIKTLQERIVKETNELQDEVKSWKQTALRKERDRIETEEKLSAAWARSEKLQKEANQEDKRVKEQVKLETQRIRDAWTLDGLAQRKGMSYWHSFEALYKRHADIRAQPRRQWKPDYKKLKTVSQGLCKSFLSNV